MATWNEIIMTMGNALGGAADVYQQMKNSDGRTNPNAKPAKKGKNAKSNKAGKRAAEQAFQRQLQLDQQKFIQDNIFDRTGATRRDISGQIERNVPKGMDYFKNTGPDRPELATRQARLDNQGLKNPWFEANAREAVDLARRKQAEPPLFPGPQNQMTPEQQLRQGGNGVEVFDNPLFSQSNPRTGLNTNTGPFVRSMDNPYGTARALFTPTQAQQPAPGPVQSLFTPQQTAQPMPQAPSWDTSFINQLSQLPMQQPQPMTGAQLTEEQFMQQNPDAGNPLEWLKSLFLPDPQAFQQLPEPSKAPFQFAPML